MIVLKFLTCIQKNGSFRITDDFVDDISSLKNTREILVLKIVKKIRKFFLAIFKETKTSLGREYNIITKINLFFVLLTKMAELSTPSIRVRKKYVLCNLLYLIC